MTQEEVRAFHQTAKEYCSLIENAGDIELCAFFTKLQRLLPLLYLQALPLERDCCAKRVPEAVSDEEWQKVDGYMGEKFSEFNKYWRVECLRHNTMHCEVDANLSEDFTDIYRDLKAGAAHWDDQNPMSQTEAVEQWRLDFSTHWSDHVLSAMNAINIILEHEAPWDD